MPHAIRYFKALSDETRLRLIHVLGQYELSVNELVRILEMGQSRVSRHLKILTEAGLLASRRDGLWAFYAAVTEGEGAAFMQATAPFLACDAVLRADADMASRIIEDRALKTRQFFNAIADHWDTLSRDVLGGFDLAQAVCAAMPQPCAVAVDLGCGTGLVLEQMRGRAGQIIGVDGSPRMLELSRRRFTVEGADRIDESISLRIGELHHLPLCDGEADFASINMVLHHLSEPHCALMEIHRVLRPGGLVMVTDFDRHTQEKMRSDYGDLWLGFDEATLQRLLLSAGLEVLKSTRRPVEQDLALNLTLARRI
ncbi:MAG: metalloregulator ArsR/SmtB family transcription factor [Bilophila sp.]